MVYCNSFRHAITGAKNRTPDEFLGGILADDMGVGKTFTTLITILASQDAATDFASLRGTHQSPASKAMPPSKATIVVVPSECMSPFKTGK